MSIGVRVYYELDGEVEAGKVVSDRYILSGQALGGSPYDQHIVVDVEFDDGYREAISVFDIYYEPETEH